VSPPAVGAKKEVCVRERIPLGWAALVVLVLVIGSAQGVLAAAHSVGGYDLTDWGVNPSVSGGTFVAGSLTAGTALVQSVNDNLYRRANGGGESYDIESLYVDADNDSIYFASIISTDPSGVWFNPYWMRQGDFGMWQGAKGSGDWPGEAPGPTESVGTPPQYGVGVRQTGSQYGKVVQGGGWTMDDGFAGPAYMQGNGTVLGSASVSVARLRNAANTADLNDQGIGNWVVKGKIARSLLPNSANGTWTFKFGPSCNNDFEVLTAVIPDRVRPPVPEPTTVALLAIGALPVLPMLRRRRSA